MKPPHRYPGPMGYPCGQGWDKAFVVTGEIPTTNGFGKSFSRTLAPIVADLQQGPDRLGWLGQYEHDRRKQLLARREQIANVLEASTSLSPQEKQSITWLLQQAGAELDAATAIHDQWKHRHKGSWPLWFGDKLADFPEANGDWCTDPEGVLSPPGPQYGAEVPGREGGTVICPTRLETQWRPRDRKIIAGHFVDAAHFLRCAEYGLWRLLLYRQALKYWYDSFWSEAPDDLVVRPKVPWEPGKIIAQPKPDELGLTSAPKIIVDPPPPTPLGEKLPPPGVPVDPAVGHTGPEGAGAATRPTRARRRRRKSSALPWAAAAAVGLGAVVLTR